MDDLDNVFAAPVEEQAEAPVPERQEVEQAQTIESGQHEGAVASSEEPPVQSQSDLIPLAKYLDQRDELKETKRRLAEYEARLQPANKPDIPDPYDDKPGFDRHINQMLDERTTQVRFEVSDRFARQAHGDEMVQGALDWAMQRAQNSPAFAQEYMTQPDPIGWIVQQHKRDAMLSDIGDNPDDWFEREAAKRGWAKPSASASAVVADAAPKQAQPPAKVPPRSLANQGSGPTDVRHVATGPLAGVDALFS
jgi:hypothetical protein